MGYPCPLDAQWKSRVLDAAKDILVIPATRSRPARDEEEMTNSPQCDDSNKRQRTAEPPDATSSEPPHVTPSQRILQETYWDSSDAKDLVGWIETDSDAKETLIRHIEQLKTVNNTNDNWRNVIMGRDPDDFCTSIDIFEIRQRSALLCCAYQNLLEHMNDWTW